MATIEDCRHAVEIVETVWIPMRDGRRLAGRLFLPRSAAERPVPVIMEYIPYRRRDGTRNRDDETHFWFAAHGYACIRVDIAGSGDSDGLVQDEYHPREQDDALDAIDWLANQPWSSGAVGMIGISWGGFNGLQVAALRPRALKAVITLCSTVDRFNTDVHFMGGCLLNDNLDWGAAFFTYAALPPDPGVVGERWREIWRNRIDGLELMPAKWLRHQRRDSYWEHGSVIEDYAAIEVPVMAVSGWADGYTDTVFHLVDNLPACKGMVGPWGHIFPHKGTPGPAIGFLQECKKWWDRWLKGMENGVEDDPALKLWVQDNAVPKPHIDQRTGRWIALPRNLAGETAMLQFPIGPSDGSGEPIRVSSNQSVGVCGGEWCAYALEKVAPDLPIDQAIDDARSAVFDFPVESSLDIVGQPVLRLRLSVDKPNAMLAVRLCDVGPDGKSTRISYGLMNLSHRDSHARPEELKPLREYSVSVPLKHAGQRIEAGHRLRVAISSSYWPTVWPLPERATVTINPAMSVMEVPVLRSERPIAPFSEAVHAPPMPATVISEGEEKRTYSYDVTTGVSTFCASRDDGWLRIEETGADIHYAKVKTFSVQDDDPLSSTATVTCEWATRQNGWEAKVQTECVMTATRDTFILKGRYLAFTGDQLFASKDFEESIPRDFN